MRCIVLLLLLTLFTVDSRCQDSLIVEGQASVSGTLVANTLMASNMMISGFNAAQITTTGSRVLKLKGFNPLLDFYDGSDTPLGFIQAYDNDFYVANRLSGSMIFRTNNLNRMAITSDGNLGIGTVSPASKVTIVGGDNNGITAGLEINSSSQQLLVDGNEIDAVTTPLYFNYNSNNDVLMRTSTRRAEFTFKHASGSGASNGFAIENTASNHVYWTMYSTNGDGNFELYYKGVFRGEFDSADGEYTNVSDRRLKEDIQPVGDVLQRVMRLQPVTYHMRKSDSATRQLGFIAQDVQPLFPELVDHRPVGDSQAELYTLHYRGFGVLAIASIQELMVKQEEQYNDLRTENRELHRRIDALSAQVEALQRDLIQHGSVSRREKYAH